jgi:hypothetical protein
LLIILALLFSLGNIFNSASHPRKPYYNEYNSYGNQMMQKGNMMENQNQMMNDYNQQ